MTFKFNTQFVHFFPLAPDKLWHRAYDNTETKSFPNNQTGPQDIATAMAHDSIISRKRYSKSVITQLKQTDCLLNASDS